MDNKTHELKDALLGSLQAVTDAMEGAKAKLDDVHTDEDARLAGEGLFESLTKSLFKVSSLVHAKDEDAEKSTPPVEEPGLPHKDKTYSDHVSGIAEEALLPLWSLKDMLLDMDIIGDANPLIDPVRLGAIIESLLKQAESQIDAVDDALERHVGRVRFVRAQATYPGASTGTILAVEWEPKEAAHV